MEEKEPEIWKPIEGYEDKYQVSNFGKVKRISGKLFKGSIDKSGYLYATLRRNKIRKSFSIHRLVAKAFIPNPNNYPLVMHLDDDPTNNHYKNLQWGTDKMNCDDKEIKCRGNQQKGENQGHSKLTEQQVLEIRDKYIPRKYSTYKLAKEYNVNQGTIVFIIKRETWKHI